MKRLITFNSALALVLFFALSSCMSEMDVVEEPITSESELLGIVESDGGENLRKNDKIATRAYFERFNNQLDPRNASGEPISSPDEFALFFPGIGIGNSTQMGKATTFLNQRLELTPEGPKTVGAPVTQFYSKELAELGIDVTLIGPEVSSVTTDGKGNSVWFENIVNEVEAPDPSTGLQSFTAQVKIVGGSGKFEDASGEGIAQGFFNPVNGEGSSTIRGEITF